MPHPHPARVLLPEPKHRNIPLPERDCGRFRGETRRPLFRLQSVEDVARAVNLLEPGNPEGVADSWKAVTDATPKIEAGRDQFVRAAVELIGVESGSASGRQRLRVVRMDQA
jgi:hypothetical protein